MSKKDELAEKELKAIVALGVLASIAVGLQLGGLQAITPHAPVGPQWTRGLEKSAILLMAYSFGGYIAALTLWLAVGKTGVLATKISTVSDAIFAVGALAVLFGMFAFFLRIVLS